MPVLERNALPTESNLVAARKVMADLNRRRLAGSATATR
jgi:hypothetical protein